VEEYLLVTNGAMLYGIIMGMLVGGAVGLPIPEDVPLVLGGVLIHSGNASAALMFLCCYSAIIVGDMIIFLIGRKLGPALFSKSWFKKRFSASRMKHLKLSLEKRSLLMIFVARHLFYLRTVTFLTCGAVRMRLARFLAADALAALISVPVMLSLGYFAANQAEDIMKNARNVSILAGVILLLIIWVIYMRRKKPKEQSVD
jgi:membrane protein DedA with SNARE-associated domain